MIIARAKKPLVSLEVLPEAKLEMHIGGAKSMVISLSDDFNAPLDDFIELHVMKLQLDTQVLLWAATSDRRLGEYAHRHFLDKRNDLYFSLASLWEICIKISLGKIQFVEDWFLVLRREMSINAIR